MADLGRPLPFPDGAFNDVIASLVLHYLQDWGPALGELRRLLKPGGRLIASVEHPFAAHIMHREALKSSVSEVATVVPYASDLPATYEGKADYFRTYDYTEEWTMGDRTARMTFWTRPLHAMTDAFTAAGFRIAVISEPSPAAGARELFPDFFANLPSGTFLCFLFFVLEAV